MSLTKLVNGVPIICSPEEEASIRADWVANEANPPKAQLKAVEQIINDPIQLAALKAALAK